MFEYKTACSQIKFSKNINISNEDCLHLNIFVPGEQEVFSIKSFIRLKKMRNFFNVQLCFTAVKTTSKLAVMVYVFGGAFVTGSDESYGPDFLLEYEIILVRIAYRLAIFGFLSLGTPEYSGNMGLKDQQLAIKWVYDNIEHFGGDKTRITLSGHSSGTFSSGFCFILSMNASCKKKIEENFSNEKTKKILQLKIKSQCFKLIKIK